MKTIAIGQYYAAKSPIHSLEARAKLIIAILYIVCTFLCKNILCYGLLLLSGFALILLSRIPFKIILRGLKPIIIITVIAVLINIFFARNAQNLLFEWRFIKIYKEGLYNALFMIVRIITLVLGTSILLTYTTTPIQLTDAIERLLKPLSAIKVPVHEFAMMMTIALRFIPTLVDETDKIMSAQKARGASFDNGSLLKRAKALIPILVPLFVSAFRRADELATAMECRCYHGGKGRTKMTVTKLGIKDLLAFFLIIAFGAGIVLLNIYGFGYSMK